MRFPLIVTTSWDDGHPSDLRVADLLDRHGLKGTFYLPRRNLEGRPVMHPSEIADLACRFEVGGHTQDHVVLSHIPPHRASFQITANKDWLEDVVGRKVAGFAYVRGRHNRLVRGLVAEAGYQYARTVRNLMSTPGNDRFQVPTTTQFFSHRSSVYVRNFLSEGPNLQRANILVAMLTKREFGSRLVKAVETCAQWGGYFHFWGHSWEIDEYDLWDGLDEFLRRLRQTPARFVSNAEWSSCLLESDRAACARAAD